MTDKEMLDDLEKHGLQNARFVTDKLHGMTRIRLSGTHADRHLSIQRLISEIEEERSRINPQNYTKEILCHKMKHEILG